MLESISLFEIASVDIGSLGGRLFVVRVSATARVLVLPVTTARVLVGRTTGRRLLITTLHSMVVVSSLLDAGRGERGSSGNRSLAHGLLLGLGATAGLAPSTLENIAANAASRVKVSCVLVKSLGQVIIASSSRVAARSIVVVSVDEMGCRV